MLHFPLEGKGSEDGVYRVSRVENGVSGVG